MFYNSRLEELRAKLNRLIEKRQMEEYHLQQAQITIDQLDMEISQIESEISAIDSMGFGVENPDVEDWGYNNYGYDVDNEDWEYDTYD